MTRKSIEEKARRILQDTVMPYRWAEKDIASSLQEAIYSLHSIRPETRYIDGRLVDYVQVPNVVDEEISINNRFEEALIYYVVHKCYLDDSTDTINLQLAESYLSKFNTKVQL